MGNGRCFYKYNDDIYLLFNNLADKLRYCDNVDLLLRKTGSKEFSNLNKSISDLFNNYEYENAKFREMFSLKEDGTNWKAALLELDEKLKLFFCDEQFNKSYIAQLSVYCGTIILKSFPGKWNVDKDDKKTVTIELQNKREINFIPYLIAELEDSRYNNPVSIYSCVEVLLATNY